MPCHSRIGRTEVTGQRCSVCSSTPSLIDQESWMSLDIASITGLTAWVSVSDENTKESLMTNEELYLAVALNGWKGNIERADKMFSGLSEEELLKEVALGKNRMIYLWGHLTATHDALLPLLGFER